MWLRPPCARGRPVIFPPRFPAAGEGDAGGRIVCEQQPVDCFDVRARAWGCGWPAAFCGPRGCGRRPALRERRRSATPAVRRWRFAAPLRPSDPEMRHPAAGAALCAGRFRQAQDFLLSAAAKRCAAAGYGRSHPQHLWSLPRAGGGARPDKPEPPAACSRGWAGRGSPASAGCRRVRSPVPRRKFSSIVSKLSSAVCAVATA